MTVLNPAAVPVVTAREDAPPPATGVAQVPSPRQKVDEVAEVPLLSLATGRFPPTLADPRSATVLTMTPPESVPRIALVIVVRVPVEALNPKGRVNVTVAGWTAYPPPPPPCVAALIVWFGQDPVTLVMFVPAIRPGEAVPVPPLATGRVPTTCVDRLTPWTFTGIEVVPDPLAFPVRVIDWFPVI